MYKINATVHTNNFPYFHVGRDSKIQKAAVKVKVNKIFILRFLVKVIGVGVVIFSASLHPLQLHHALVKTAHSTTITNIITPIKHFLLYTLMKMDILMLSVFKNSGGLPKNFGKLVAPK